MDVGLQGSAHLAPEAGPGKPADGLSASPATAGAHDFALTAKPAGLPGRAAMEAALPILFGPASSERRTEPIHVFVEHTASDGPTWGKDLARLRVESDSFGPESFRPTLLQTALRHLIENALRYSPPDSPVFIRVGHHDAKTRISVHNEGAVHATVERKLFQPNVKGPGGGNGMGLFVVKVCAVAMNGRAEYMSGNGQTLFTLSFPTVADPRFLNPLQGA